MFKRSIDLFVSAIGLTVLAPVLGILILLIRWQSPGPGLFAQVRVGRNGRLFRCRKLRTMREGVPQVPTHETAPDWSTPIGRRLRRLKLDELPQLWNVLKGEMSLVGPRPCLPTQEELIAARAERGVLALRPGITGLAQVRGIDMSDPIRLAEIDAEYARRASPRLDLGILASTFGAPAP